MPTYNNVASRIQCRHCKGAGTVPLTERMARTLDLFKTHKQLQAVEVWNLLQETRPNSKSLMTIEAMNGRLESLRRQGFLARTRSGNAYLYSLPTHDPKPSQRTVPAQRGGAATTDSGRSGPTRRAKSSRAVPARARS